MPNAEPVTPAQACLSRLAAGDSSARGELIRLCRDRVLLMTRGLLTRFPKVRRWAESDDVVQNVLIRLDGALADLRPTSTQHLLALAATNVRREVIDLVRRYFGPQGIGANHATPPGPAAGRDDPAPGAGQDDPALLAEWAELHEQVANLPDEERAVVDLHWYHGLNQAEVAHALGVSVKTVKRRWAAAKLRLAALLGPAGPE